MLERSYSAPLFLYIYAKHKRSNDTAPTVRTETMCDLDFKLSHDGYKVKVHLVLIKGKGFFFVSIKRQIQ